MKLFWSAAAIAVLVLAGVLYLGDRNKSGRTDRTGTAAGDEQSSGVHSKATPVKFRVGTEYYFLPGGILSVAQFRQSFLTDAALAAQFPDFNFSKAHFELLSKDTCAFVAYRVGTKFGWTRHCIMLRKNETVLTDGRYTLRVRCGNLISATTKIPLLPQGVQEEIDTDEILPIPSDYVVTDVPELPPDVWGTDAVPSPAPFPLSPGPTGSGPFPIGPGPVAGPTGGFPVLCCGPRGAPIPLPMPVPDGDKYMGLVAGLLLILAGVYYAAERKRR